MFVKQIDMRRALELAAKGQEVLVLIPGDMDPDWKNMVPDTLNRMLEGCLFFRKEPAMRVSERAVYSHLQKVKEEIT